MNTTRLSLYGCLLLIFMMARTGTGAGFVWTGAGDGVSWTDESNWDAGAGYPDGADDQASFTNGAAAVTIPAELTLGGFTQGTNFTGTNSLAGNLFLVASAGGSGGLTVDGGRLLTGKDLVSGITAAGSIVIGSNGTVVVHRSSTTGEGLGQTIAAAGMHIDGTLSADGEGFGASSGPGKGGGYLSPAGTHGGRGGYNSKPTYGSFTNPVALGSGGNYPGGGAIVLRAAGELHVAGRISPMVWAPSPLRAAARAVRSTSRPPVSPETA
jgi:hypothetical protein